MKTKTLAILMTALSIGVSPVGLMSASAQDAPIIPKKGAAQSGQSGGAATQQPDAATDQGTQQPSGSVGSSSGASSGATTDGSSGQTTEPSAKTQPDAKTQSGGSGETSGSSKTIEPGQASPESQQPAGSKDAGTQTDSGETQKSGEAKPSGGSSESQSNSNTSVDSSKTQTNTTTNVNISVEQQTEIRSVVKEVHVEPVRETDFTVSVGTSIPKKIRLEPLPPRIIEIVPQYKAYRFFILADGRIVIVDPSSFTIVYIISA
ncbi:hypothetical protein AMC87_CH01775 [Rhizobium phaseoli]|uniref:DUF1236 domain-containing protein n=1 Tax=Rhizobium phaseoli TaxID=396 RepID=UPI0007EB52CD|nr:DUF1236 domain-containing protein [Rhizobium phaseoli]ANL46470.1 hypothetical protein AMC87_CH01775 [Rhizobium phaseoli]MDK4728021.1 DUF1236 domain-containing protein [Rhizobium phaseoli]NKE87909.1 DUF1236 domain-containing protein [Rhizobium phaseoli]PDS32036.1 DUF1236 domain-containing protein [Rhizobium phaseoli]PDS69905.1 DUF1236 domain-containing protein [Rhizobium phaseoli]